MRRLVLLGMIAGGFFAVNAQSPGVRVDFRQDDEGAYVFVARNDFPIPVWLSVEFTSLTNLSSDVELPVRVSIPAGAKDARVCTLTVVEPGKRAGFRMSYTHAKGDPRTVRPDVDYLYTFPFAHGAKFQVTQGYKGAFTHYDDNTYALDFNFPAGTPIHAARAGLVVDVKENSTRGGPTAAYARDGNYVMVAHSDGTFGNYVHLRYNGAAVSVGDRVNEGDLIGHSGATGVASGPHLHFDVRVPQEDGTMMSIPTKFRSHAGEAVEPVEGEFYYSAHPGKPPFEVRFGRDLTNESLAGHDRRVGPTNRVDVRAEQIDDTYVFYAVNGRDADFIVTVDFRLTRMQASLPEPISLRVPARSERFLLFLRPVRDGRSRDFSYSFTYSVRPANG